MPLKLAKEALFKTETFDLHAHRQMIPGTGVDILPEMRLDLVYGTRQYIERVGRAQFLLNSCRPENNPLMNQPNK